MNINAKVTPVFYENMKSFNKDYRVIANQGGTRSSKTYSILQLIIQDILKNNHHWSVASISLPHLRRGAYRDFVQILNKMGLYNIKKHDRTNNIYYLKGFVEFFGMEHEQRARGPGRQFLFLNEVNLLNYDVYKQLSIRTTEKIIADYNAWDQNNWFYDIADDPNNKLIISNYKNNIQNLTKAQIKEIEESKYADENWYNVFGLGKRGAAIFAVFPHIKIGKFTDVFESEFFGLDFGFSNPTALVRIRLHNNTVYVKEELYESRLQPSEIAFKVKEIVKDSLVYCETASPVYIDALERQQRVRVVSADKDVKNGIIYCKQFPTVFDEYSPNLRKELALYRFQTDMNNKIIEDRVIKENDHLMDAYRYALYTSRNRNKLKY